MRYLLQKDTEEIPSNDPDTPAETKMVFRCYVWPGPYNFATTPDDQKLMSEFPFSEDGKQEAAFHILQKIVKQQNKKYQCFKCNFNISLHKFCCFNCNTIVR